MSTISFSPDNIISFAIIFLTIFSAVVGFLVGLKPYRPNNVNLRGDKLETSDECIKDALPHLKITNMWDTKR